MDEGTLINKDSLLKDTTAALFGLGTDAVPDDVLALRIRFNSGLGNEYLWKKEKDGVISYVNSSSPDAYPPAKPDGYTYTALGQVANKAQIESNEYIGTGTDITAFSLSRPMAFIVVCGYNPSGNNREIGIISDYCSWCTQYVAPGKPPSGGFIGSVSVSGNIITNTGYSNNAMFNQNQYMYKYYAVLG